MEILLNETECQTSEVELDLQTQNKKAPERPSNT